MRPDSKSATQISTGDSAKRVFVGDRTKCSVGRICGARGRQFQPVFTGCDANRSTAFRQRRCAPSRAIRLDPSANRTYHYWHVFVEGLQPGQLYGYRAHGPFDPSQGLRFDASKALLDPYSRGVVVPIGYSRDAAARNGFDNAATSMKSVVVDHNAYEWEGDVPLHRPCSQTIIYELHVGDLPVIQTPGYRNWEHVE
jgi:pullulanase/glycogen debranching enzyme